MIAGNISGAGDVAVGAAGAVPVINKTTKAWIGNEAGSTRSATARARASNTGAFTVEPFDPRFNPAEAIEGEEIINLAADMTPEEKAHYSDGFTEGEAVRYDNGGGENIVGLPCGETSEEVEEKGEKVIKYVNEQMRRQHRWQRGHGRKRTNTSARSTTWCSSRNRAAKSPTTGSS